jgi:hypothetical protein
MNQNIQRNGPFLVIGYFDAQGKEMYVRIGAERDMLTLVHCLDLKLEMLQDQYDEAKQEDEETFDISASLDRLEELRGDICEALQFSEIINAKDSEGAN